MSESTEGEDVKNSEQTAKRSVAENIIPHQWKKGKSGNPDGRPLGSRNRSTIVREWLECDATDGFGGTMADQLVRKQILKADNAATDAFKEIFDSAYGKNTEVQEIKQTGDMNINITRRVVNSSPEKPEQPPAPPAEKAADGN